MPLGLRGLDKSTWFSSVLALAMALSPRRKSGVCCPNGDMFPIARLLSET